MAAVILFLLLDEKEPRIKADIIGPNAHSGRFPAMSAGPARPTHSVFGVPAHGTRVRNAISFVLESKSKNNNRAKKVKELITFAANNH